MSLRSRLARVESALAVEPGEITAWVYVGNGGAPTVSRRPGPAGVYTINVPDRPEWLPGNAMVVLGAGDPDEDDLTPEEQAEIRSALIESLTPEQARLVRAARNVVLIAASD